MNTKYKFYAQHMHMHSCYQPGASMEGHMYHANKLGMKYIWFTDHDIRMGRKQNEVTGFDFESDTLIVNGENGRFWGFKALEHSEAVLTKETAFEGTQSMLLDNVSSQKEWTRSGVTFVSSGKSHCKSLLSDIRLGVALKTKCADWSNARVILDIRLSQRPPEHEPAHIYLVIGNTEEFIGLPHSVTISLEQYYDWHKYCFNLSEIVLSEEACKCVVGGLDNAFDTLSIYADSRNNAEIKLWVDDFTIDAKKNAQETFESQKLIAKEIGTRYDVTPFLGMEISEAGSHKNCFSGNVPVIPYEDLNYQVSHEEACEWVKRYNGVFALNHPFECFKRVDVSSVNLDYETKKIAEKFIHNKCWGAKLIEVGFPEGKYFPIQEHLKLWDILSMNGQFLTGYGSSDNHSNITSWYDGNNFATWIGVEENISEPKEDDFVSAIKRGCVYMGNPVYINDSVIFETERHAPMGSIVMMQKGQSERVRFAYNGVETGWLVRWIRSGKVIKETVVQKGLYEDNCYISNVQNIEPVRIEMYNAEGICLMLTNPIYFCEKKAVNYDLPMERLFMDSIRDKMLLLHIGDTHSETYTWYEELIQYLKPEMIIHTGDMADEVKAGRMPEKRGEYCEKVKQILDVLRKTSDKNDCRFCIIPGNNDLPDELIKIDPNIQLISPDTVIDMEGYKVCLSHEKRHITKETDIYLYGHSERDEHWSMLKNTNEEKQWYLNSLWGVFLLSLPERVLYCWERPEYAAHIWP